MIASRFFLPRHECRVEFKTAFLTYSGGTAPALHRTSLLSPQMGHLRTLRS
jgi:hypothetical protein